MTKEPATVLLIGGGNIIAGKEIMLLTLARGLRGAGMNVEFITSIWGGKDEFLSRLQSEGFRFYRLRLGFISLSLQWKPIIWTLDQLRYWPSLVVGYLKTVRAVNPNAIVHTNWHHALLLLPFLDHSRDVYWCHEIVPDKWLYRQVFRAIARRTSRMASVSHATARSLAALGISPAKIVVIHNGIADIGGLRKKADFGDTSVCIGIAGQIGRWKGHEDLIEAFGLLAKTNGGLTLRIIGNAESDFVTLLRARIAQLGLEGRVMWTGFIKDRALIYEGIDICVVPSRSEDPLPTTAIEAAFCALPVVATNAGGLPEIVEDGVTGFLVPVGAPNRLAKAIGKLVADPALRRRMGEQGRIRAGQLFLEQRFVEDFCRLLGKIAYPVASQEL